MIFTWLTHFFTLSCNSRGEKVMSNNCGISPKDVYKRVIFSMVLDFASSMKAFYEISRAAVYYCRKLVVYLYNNKYENEENERR